MTVDHALTSKNPIGFEFAVFDAALSQAIASTFVCRQRPILVGLCGPQGSGKSTTAVRLMERLALLGHPATLLSLDDFYLTKSERLALAREVHPLLEVRGVPGTHDVQLLQSTIDSLKAGKDAMIPSFDKTTDNRADPRRWRRACGLPGIILLEGWCVGVRPEPQSALDVPINQLERDEDSGGKWRRYVNQQIEDDYCRLFAKIDLRIMLKAPSFECVHRWRAEQERSLLRSEGSSAPMDAASIARFIAHYERITRWLTLDEPADLVADLDQSRKPQQLRMLRR